MTTRNCCYELNCVTSKLICYSPRIQVPQNMALFGVGTFKEMTDLDWLRSLMELSLIILLHILKGDLDMKTDTRNVALHQKDVRKESSTGN